MTPNQEKKLVKLMMAFIKHDTDTVQNILTDSDKYPKSDYQLAVYEYINTHTFC